ncbi:heparinase II/III family protein [Ciceribacter thiooxidans]|uniref:Heparinase II/III family protein n=1 Tax=Ciceribacter thiooxidans TaxID=1969821 RepID=A0ABV7HTK5_9HYPH|nr:heparinase II/III family protein [Ciceribacter thiooxidans]
MRFTERQRLVYLYLREAWRRISRQIAIGHISALRFAGSGSGRLIVAPTDLRIVDPFVAEEILVRRFPLAGKILDAGDRSPFEFEPPSQLFAVRLHSFAWLRHVRADKSPGACANARAIVDDWIRSHGTRIGGLSWDADVISQRVISWLSHSPVVLQDAEAGFYRRFLGNLAFQIRYLNQIADHVPDGLPRLRVRIALAMASICMQMRGISVRRAARHLDRELDRQILPDGGHISRNPNVAVELLFDLLPLRQTYINLGHEIPVKLIPAVDRMYPAVRFFRHGSGDLALFNGATSILANELMSVLRYDETAGQPFKSLPHSQYHRLAGGSAVILVDTGYPRSTELSKTAHAGCLSFELSSGRHRLIVNSGSPRFAGERLRQLARTTAAHSTVSVSETSSATISRSPFLGPLMISGVTAVEVTRQTAADGSDRLCARHNGYLVNFGLWHERELRLNEAGTKVAGRDRFLMVNGEPLQSAPPPESVARFHIHPAVHLEQVDDRVVHLIAPDGEIWMFSVPTGEVVISEDVFFADASGARASEQLEIVFDGPEIRWFLTHKA